MQSLGVFHYLAIICLAAVVTCRRSLNWRCIRTGGFKFNSVLDGSGARFVLDRVESILNRSDQNVCAIGHVHIMCRKDPWAAQPLKQLAG